MSNQTILFELFKALFLVIPAIISGIFINRMIENIRERKQYAQILIGRRIALYEELSAQIFDLKIITAKYLEWIFESYYSLPENDRYHLMTELDIQNSKLEHIFEKSLILYGKCHIHLTDASFLIFTDILAYQNSFVHWKNELKFRAYFTSSLDNEFQQLCDNLLVHLKSEINTYLKEK